MLASAFGNLGTIDYGCWCALRPLELLGSFLEALWGTSLGKLLEKLLGALAGLVPGSSPGSAGGTSPWSFAPGPNLSSET